MYLCGKKVAAAGCRNDDYMITPSRSQTLKSCKDIMQKHKATVELKRNGYEGGERFAKGSNTGNIVVHIQRNYFIASNFRGMKILRA